MGEENGSVHGYPFSFEEEDKGVVKNCNFENMKSLEVNKRGITQFRAKELTAKNDAFLGNVKLEIGIIISHLKWLCNLIK